MMSFNFFAMAGNHEERVVDNFTDGNMTIDTCRVTDGSRPYDTGIQHPNYGDGSWIIVEAYDTKDEAQIGHDKWVDTMTNSSLPKELKDCNNAGIAQLGAAMFGDDWHDEEYN